MKKQVASPPARAAAERGEETPLNALNVGVEAETLFQSRFDEN